MSQRKYDINNKNFYMYKIIGHGNNIYLKCHDLNIIDKDLKTEDWEEAKAKSINIIEEKLFIMNYENYCKSN